MLCSIIAPLSLVYKIRLYPPVAPPLELPLKVKQGLRFLFKFEKRFYANKDLKEKLHSLIESTNNEILLEDLLLEAENRINTRNVHEAEGLSKEDYEDLLSLVNEPPEKDTISYNELKQSLSKWFIK